ncbi:MAG: translocase FtsK [Thermoleophilia bacterium]|nr:translocase FtsK [Thermoleophilia bacterium]
MATKRTTGSSRSGASAAKRAPAKRAPAKKAPAARATAASRSKARAKAAPKDPLLEPQQRRDMAGLAMVAFGCYLGGILYIGWQGGTVGGWLEGGTKHMVGGASYIFPFLAVVYGLLMVLRSELADPGPFRAGLYLFVPSLLLAFGADRFGLGSGSAPHAALHADVVAHHGGFLGGALYFLTYNLFGDAGTTIVCLLGLTLGILFTSGSSAQAATRWWAGRMGTAATAGGEAARAAAVRVSESAVTQLEAAKQLAVNARDGMPFDGSSSFPDIFGDVPSTFAHATVGGASVLELPSEETTADTPKKGRRTKRVSPGAGGPADPESQLMLIEPAAPQPEQAELDASDVDEPTDAGDIAAELASLDAAVGKRHDGYELPSPSILTKGTGIAKMKPADVEKTKRLLVETFGHFGIESVVLDVVPGPRVSRYELALAPGTKMSKIENLRKDLSYALATTEIRILAPIPGKSAIGIEVENPTPSIVTLGDIHQKPPKDASPLYVSFGKDITGDVVGADLAKMPHLLVAGTTGAGKSGCMNALLSSIVLNASPDEVKMLLIDPKKVELSTYEGLPHLLTPVVTNMKKAANALGNVVAQMEERYSSMEIAGARTLPEYNKIREARGDAPVPYILVIIDELADLVMQAKADVEDAVIRVAQKGRAAGFHMVVATQRPSVDVITGMIKSNIPSRIAFAVSSQTDSRVILDQNGAETLLGSGDMLFKPIWARAPQRVQGAWISEKEVRQLCDAAREQREPEFDDDLLAEPEPAAQSSDAEFVDSDDRLPEAIRLVAEFQTCSASFFQRRMRVGYTRGARLVDMLERRGVCAPGEGPRPRNVLITQDDVPRLLDELTSDLLGRAEGGEA